MMVARAVVCLSLWLSVCQVRGFQIPAEMNRTIQNLLLHYKIPSKERINGRPVFSRELLDGRMESKRVLMGGILEAYEKLLGHMLKELPTPSPDATGSATIPAAATEMDGAVRTELRFILKKVQDLRRHNYQEQDKLLQGLQSIRHIQMDNLVIQSKALWELPLLYKEASSLSDSMRKRRRRRRRRQAWRIKTHPGALDG